MYIYFDKRCNNLNTFYSLSIRNLLKMVGGMKLQPILMPHKSIFIKGISNYISMSEHKRLLKANDRNVVEYRIRAIKRQMEYQIQ